MKVIFLDRDGVVNQEVGYLHKIKDFVFIDGVFSACQAFQKLDFKIIIITNQSGIARGYYQHSDFDKLNIWMINKFKQNKVDILAVFYCPHAPEDGCDCRKPKAGMFIKAQKKHGINMSNSWMIGDKENDITAANTAGIKNTILVRSGHKINEKQSNARFILDSIHQSKTIISSPY
ncbi:MAG: D-glycero-beta-D-manno-heptose 1,7-bisphosphate 7-phosphatase [Gammaproteobacteria bacterium]|nr:D-glycero-beta-D-manno-heptose 1,7-bisphosphate 7-phosphatase [Gammaproteobacteria bacterium]